MVASRKKGKKMAEELKVRIGFLDSVPGIGLEFFEADPVPFGPQGFEWDWLALEVQVGVHTCVFRLSPEGTPGDIVAHWENAGTFCTQCGAEVNPHRVGGDGYRYKCGGCGYSTTF